MQSSAWPFVLIASCPVSKGLTGCLAYSEEAALHRVLRRAESRLLAFPRGEFVSPLVLISPYEPLPDWLFVDN